MKQSLVHTIRRSQSTESGAGGQKLFAAGLPLSLFWSNLHRVGAGGQKLFVAGLPTSHECRVDSVPLVGCACSLLAVAAQVGETCSGGMGGVYGAPSQVWEVCIRAASVVDGLWAWSTQVQRHVGMKCVVALYVSKK